jgi:mono/diheme cytochrome c family protein
LKTNKFTLFAAALILGGFGATAQNNAAGGNAENGKRIFMKVGCYECHGTVGAGQLTGPRIAPHPLALAAFTAFLRKPSGGMPPYRSAVMSDAEIADIRAYLASVPEPTPVKDNPLLNH